MKFNRTGKVDEKGVSPVIAVILMVAITVVLAGVLWAMIRIEPPGDDQIRMTIKLSEETFGWNVEIVSISGNLRLEETKFQMEDNEGILLYELLINNIDPQPFDRGISKVYPMTMSGPVLDNTTGDVIDSGSSFNDYERCYIAYVDNTDDERVTSGDSFYIYKDYNNDNTDEISSNFSILIKAHDDIAISKEL